jgi:protein-tyrosine phosphatase
LLAGEYPAAHLSVMQTTSISDFIDLTTADEGLPAYSERLAADQRWQRFGIADYSVPSAVQMQQILDAVGQAIMSGGQVYLHCHGGVGRTGTVAGCLLVAQGFPAHQALELIARKWQVMAKSAHSPISPETDEQRDFIRQWPSGPVGERLRTARD